MKRGRKLSCWMWYVFPSVDMGRPSSMAKRFAIKSLDEARSYLEHEMLGPRLREIAQAAVDIDPKSDAVDVFGDVDALKLHGCATLFASVSPPGSVFHALLDRYFQSKLEPITVAWLEKQGHG